MTMASILEHSGYDPDRKLKVIGSSPIKNDGLDKVTGRAKYGADLILPGMLVGKILRSPHPHAIIVSIDTSKAQALPGVKAVVTRGDFPEHPQGTPMGDLSRNLMAREKALYEGHAVAAVAANTEAIARQALKLIAVDYQILPHVIDPIEAMAPGAPILHDYLRTKGIAGAEHTRTNVVERLELSRGDVAAGFRQADVVVEREFRTRPIHQSYLEPQGCVANADKDGQVELWCCTQGHFIVRDQVAGVLKLDAAQVRVTASELGGGFGGKTTSYAEVVAVALSRKAGRPVKIVLARSEVFRCTGPVAATRSRIKIGATKDGRITAAEAELIYQTGPFTGSAFFTAPQSVFTRYDLKNVRAVAYEVVSNRPKVAAFRAPNVPQCIYAAESAMDELAEKLGMDPIDLRLKNAMREGSTTIYGETLGPIGVVATLEAAKSSAHYNAPLGPNQGRGVALGFWFNRGGETTGSLTIAPDGSVTILVGVTDVAGALTSIRMLAAEELGVPVDKIRAVVADTSALGHNMQTAGSRSVFAGGMITIDCARKTIAEMCKRAARIWGVPEEGVLFADGACRPASSNVGDFAPLSVADIARQAGTTGGAIAGHSELTVTGAGAGFGVHIADVEVDKQTGHVKVVRDTVIADAGKVVHRGLVEGQFQGAAVQGMGWALNEEYIYGSDGRLQNASFLDYRVPVASDVPMIDPITVEVPNPKHPYGVRGIGETPVTSTLGAIANAVTHAIGIRPCELPMSPPRLLKLIEAAGQRGESGNQAQKSDGAVSP
jgi:CO/xanthine dehydrogenase Mo-binding subunit